MTRSRKGWEMTDGELHQPGLVATSKDMDMVRGSRRCVDDENVCHSRNLAFIIEIHG